MVQGIYHWNRFCFVLDMAGNFFKNLKKSYFPPKNYQPTKKYYSTQLGVCLKMILTRESRVVPSSLRGKLKLVPWRNTVFGKHCHKHIQAFLQPLSSLTFWRLWPSHVFVSFSYALSVPHSFVSQNSEVVISTLLWAQSHVGCSQDFLQGMRITGSVIFCQIWTQNAIFLK